MRRVKEFALATAALGLMAVATPAFADVTVVTDPAPNATSCLSFVFASPTTEIACAGGYTIPNEHGNGEQGNLLSGSPVGELALDALVALGYTGDGSFGTDDKIDLPNGANTLDFGQIMSGVTIIGIHYGGAGDSGGEATSFFKLLVPDGTTSITISDRNLGGANSLGLSNSVLFSTGGPSVPEPATWAMMLVGFGGIGMAMRRGRKQSGRLLQIA